jgi:DNA-binding transcriptional ArsR family regulator
MQTTEYNQLETLFLALADKTRLRLLTLMADNPVPVGFLVDQTGENQPKVSRHLAYLRNCGVVTTSRDGKRIYYSIDPYLEGVAGETLAAVIGVISGDRPRPFAAALEERPARHASRRSMPEPVYVDTPMQYVPDEEDEEPSAYEAETERRQPEADMDVFLL